MKNRKTKAKSQRKQVKPTLTEVGRRHLDHPIATDEGKSVAAALNLNLHRARPGYQPWFKGEVERIVTRIFQHTAMYTDLTGSISKKGPR